MYVPISLHGRMPLMARGVTNILGRGHNTRVIFPRYSGDARWAAWAIESGGSMYGLITAVKRRARFSVTILGRRHRRSMRKA